jgi:uncharacterized protein YggE
VPALRKFAPFFALLALGTAVAAAVVVGGSAPVQAAPGDPAADAGVEVQGVGTAVGTPDVLHVTVGVEVGGSTVGDALGSANSAAGRVLDALHGAGVAKADIQTANVHVYPRYGNDGQQVTGYLAGQDLAVTLRDLATAGATISTVVAAGGDAARVQGIAFDVDDDAALQEQARKLAFADARAKAEQYATLAGRKLGGLVLVQEQMTPSGPVPMAAGDSSMAAGEAVPISPGSADVTLTVDVRWSLV